MTETLAGFVAYRANEGEEYMNDQQNHLSRHPAGLETGTDGRRSTRRDQHAGRTTEPAGPK